MPTVPRYDTPTVSPTGGLDVAVGPEMFGSQVGVAEQQVGKGLEDVSTAIATNTLKLQQRNNEATAKEAFFNATVEAGKTEAWYRSLQGKDVTANYEQYVGQLKAIREKYLAQIPNPEARHIFDQDFTRRIGFSIVDGAKYSAAANKQYNIGTNESVLRQSAEDAARDPQNGAKVDYNREVARRAARNISVDKGEGPEQAEERQKQTDSAIDLLRLHSLARTDPSAAERLLSERKDSMLPSDVEHATDTIERNKRTREADYHRGIQLLKQATEEASDRRESEVLRNLYSKPQDVTAQSIVNDPNLTRSAQERLVKWVERANKPETETKVSQQNMAGLLSQVRSGQINNLDEVYTAFTSGQINKADFNFLKNEFVQARSPEGEVMSKQVQNFINLHKSGITQSNVLTGNHDAPGDRALYRFEWDLNQEMTKLREAGKDPRVLLDPSSPEYFGAKGRMEKYKVPLTESQEYLMERAGAAPVQKVEKRKEGETISEWRKRTGQ